MMLSATRTARAWNLARSPLAWVTLLLFGVLLAPVRGQDLANQAEALMGKHALGEAVVSIYAVDLRTGAELLSIHPDRALIPASTQKLLTAGAALLVLGDEFAFETRFERAGDTLIVRGGGDPAFGDPDLLNQAANPMSPEQLLDAVARGVAKHSRSPIRQLIVDDRIFDRVTIHPAWEPDDLVRPYAAAVAGFNHQFNVARILVSPSRTAGAAPTLAIEPAAPWLVLENNATTGARGSNTIWATRTATPNRFSVFGSVVTRPPVPLEVTVVDPALWAGRLLADRLTTAGIEVGERSMPGFEPNPAVRLAAPDERLPEAQTVAIVRTPMREILTRVNRDSANLYAEALSKRMAFQVTGEPGSWDAAAAVIRMTLSEQLGPQAAAETVVSDGSGLSRLNRVSARTLVSWLRLQHADAHHRELWLASMATPGEGTFTSRFRNARLRHQVMGKSGTLTGVRTLAGYVLDPATGEGIAYAVLVNSAQGKPPVGVNARDFADALTAALDEHLAERIGEHAMGG